MLGEDSLTQRKTLHYFGYALRWARWHKAIRPERCLAVHVILHEAFKQVSVGDFAMGKSGILIEIPGLGTREIKTIVSDYTGTLSCAGRLVPGVKEKLMRLLELVDIHVVSSDSFGTAAEELAGIVRPHILSKERHDLEKQEYVKEFDVGHVAAFGNGNNDRLLLKTVKESDGLAIAVDNGEGCAIDALTSANLFIVGAANALNLLLEVRSCKATLRY
jgi:soluble P-type ATPase